MSYDTRANEIIKEKIDYFEDVNGRLSNSDERHYLYTMHLVERIETIIRNQLIIKEKLDRIIYKLQ